MFAVWAALLVLIPRPRLWTRPARDVVARQVVFVGGGSLMFISLLAVLVATVAVIQAAGAGGGGVIQPRLLNPLLVAVVARELGPVLANLIVLAKDGTRVAAEMGIMKVTGEVRALEARGGDPLTWLIMPRACGAALAAAFLTVTFVCVAFLTGFFVGTAVGYVDVDLHRFLASIWRSLEPIDWVAIPIKSVLPAMLTSVICATHGLRVTSMDELPEAVKGGASRSLAALFLVSATVSILAYA